MKPEQQRIAIAEACGWKHQNYPGKMPMGCIAGKPNWWFTHELPDYLNDLSAMHEVEKVLNNRQLERYHQELCDTCRPDGSEPDSIDDLLNSIRSTSAQRAEAFLRTIGKWEDVE
jgi:hypothetical protein